MTIRGASSSLISFAVGTGRCGTVLMKRLMQAQADIAAFHELNPLNETFHRYARWYGLPIDNAGFLHQKFVEIQAAQAGGLGFFESSAYLSLSVQELADRFDARVVLMIRHPEPTINSYLKKGWYREEVHFADTGLAPGFQATPEFHHFLGRPVPQGDQFTTWQKQGRAAKLAWYWAALNERVLKAFEALPPDRCRVQKLEDLTYDAYVELAAFLGSRTRITAAEFQAIAGTRPNAFSDLPSVADWTTEEARDALAYVTPLATRMGYDLATMKDRARDSR